MSDIFQLLTNDDSFLETGTVEEYLGNSKYGVRVRGRYLTVRSAVERLFANGTCVVINRVANLRFIVGVTGQFDIKTEKEVVVDA
jgi:hypothetical protein